MPSESHELEWVLGVGNQVHFLRFKSHWHRRLEALVVEAVLDRGQLAVLDVGPLWLTDRLLQGWVRWVLLLVVLGFLGHARGNELSVGSGLDRMVDYWVRGFNWVGEHELCHFYVISEDVYWIVLSFHNCDKIVIRVYFFWWCVEARVLENCKRLKVLVKSFITLPII